MAMYDIDILGRRLLADSIEMTSACLIRVQSAGVLVTTLPSRERQESRAPSTRHARRMDLLIIQITILPQLASTLVS